MSKQPSADKKIIDTIMKEAVAGDLDDMKMIASTVHNRSKLTGATWKEVISARKQYSAYTRKSWPVGVNTAKNRALAEQAVKEVMTKGPTTNATYYATPSAVGRLPSGLSQVGKTKGHIAFTDPKNRPIATKRGFIAPTIDRIAKFAEQVADTVATSTVDAANAVRETVGLDSAAQRGGPSRPQDVGPLGQPASMAEIDFDLGPGRPNKPSSDIVDTISKSVAEALGPGYSATVTSGMESPLGIQVGSNRHKTGLAADFSIQDPSGRTLNARDDRAAMESVAEMAASKGVKGIGVGTNYMGGTHMHMDKFDPGVGQDNEWGNIGNAIAGKLASARKGLTSTMAEKGIPADRPASPTQIAGLQVGEDARAFDRSMSPTQIAGLQDVQDQREIDRSAPAASPSVASALGIGEAAAAAPKASAPARAEFDRIAAGENLPDAEPSGPSMADLGALAGSMVGPAPDSVPGAFGLTPNRAMAELGALVGSLAGPAQAAEAPAAAPSARQTEIESMAALEAMMPGFAAQPSPLAMAPAPPSNFAVRPEVVAPNTMPDPNAAILSAPALSAPVNVPARKVAEVAQFAPPEDETIAPVRAPAPVRTAVAAPATRDPNEAIAAAARSFTPADIYGGQIGQAVDNSGLNTVSRDALGRTAVTNKFGVTTVTDATGRQVATTDTGPLSAKSLSEAKDPNESIFSGIGKSMKGKMPSTKSMVGTVLGAALGTAVAGAPGAAIGAALGRKLSKMENGPLGSIFGKNTFPDAPPAKEGATIGSNRSEGGMRSISPAAADAIGRSLGGLY